MGPFVAVTRKRVSVAMSPDAGGAASGSPLHEGLLRVLIVEDSLDTANVLQTMLRQWGYSSRVCTSAHEALALAPYYEPQVALIDIGLPDMDGWELVRRLQRQGAKVETTFIAVTAHGEEQDFQQSRAAGITYHLVKPAFQSQLRQILDRLAGEP
ncbi:MAG TPA: response regulator [Pirellulales bacterium]|nr:response regulator [Pirellulales bacterium]